MPLFLTFDFSTYFKYADFRRYPYSAAQELIEVGTESGNNQLYLKISLAILDNRYILVAREVSQAVF